MTQLLRRGAYPHRDGVNARLRPRRVAGLVAIINGGAIWGQFDYDGMLQSEGLRVGSVNEDLAFESIPGDIFQLGNIAYRIIKLESGRVYVESAQDTPPNTPFWFDEVPGAGGAPTSSRLPCGALVTAVARVCREV